MAETLKKIISSRKFFVLVMILAAFLRLWKLSDVPVSLFGDELDVGYHAYSILKTGKDYSGNFLPFHFQSLAEWRTPLYLYSAVPTVALFGISPLGVRLPAAFFGILSVFVLWALVYQITKSKIHANMASFVLSVSPWHIQYSRAGFEVTELLFFLLLGLLFFFKSQKDGKYLWVSVASFCVMPWVYSTAKFFTPFLLLFLFISYHKNILKIKRKYLLFSVFAGILVGGPIAYSTIFGGGTERFSYIGVFTDPTTESEVGTARQNDARVRGEKGEGLTPTITDKLIHNKFAFWGKNIIKNYYQAASFDFLFVDGDPNLRHSIKGMGQFYKVEIVPLLLGAILFFASFENKKIKFLIAFWLAAGIVPAAITRDGGHHATRLILILPPLVFLISYGLKKIVDSRFLFFPYAFIFLFSFMLYQHQYWFHNPWDSERWWHYGWKDAISSMKEVEKDFDRVIISSSDEPPWIFFAGWGEFPPEKWHMGFPFEKEYISGFGMMSFIDKYYFGSPQGKGVYDWAQVLDEKTLYLASAKEVNINLIAEPQRTPNDIRLIKAIAFPSGEPAFYLVTKKSTSD